MIKTALNKIMIVAVFFTLLSCGKEKNTDTTDNQVTVADSISQETTEASVTIDDAITKKFPIGKGKLGPIAIGMTMAKANSLLTDFEKQKAEGWDFGYDGGGEAWIYNKNGKQIFALVPGRDDDVIIAIIAIDKELKTAKGIRPGMTVKELVSFYPNEKIYFDEMMGWEYMYDDVNGWEMVFQTSENNTIGEYPNGNIEKPVFPKRMDVKSDWIDISAPVTQNDCSLLKNGGNFTYKDPQGQDVKVNVNDNTWTEEHKKGEYITIAKMKWTGQCTYENTLLMSSLPGFSLPPGTVMQVTIDKVEGFDIYFTATAAGKSYHSKLTKI